MAENPNDRQVGGTHYKGGKIQHWDYITAMDLDYLQGYSSKYVVRWRKQTKEKGLQDLEKTKHIVEKMLDLATNGWPKETGYKGIYANYARLSAGDIATFLVSNDIVPILDRRIIAGIFQWRSPEDLETVIIHIDKLIEAHK